MPSWIRQCAVAGFALWLVLRSGAAYPQLTAHIGQHEHHNAGTHATALCSWLCIAADAVESTAVTIAPVHSSTFLEQAAPLTQFSLFQSSQPPSRAPPFA